jgi:hypothetical protein
VEPSQQAKKILSELNYDFRDFTIDHFIDWIETVRGRKFILYPWTMPSGMFGAWMTDGDEPKEYIFYRDSISRLHQIHVILHELSHFLCGHPTKTITKKLIQESRNSGRVLPFNDLVQLRSLETSIYEHEAESLASLIQNQVIRYSQIERLTRGISSDENIADYLNDLGLI